jgi:hypothetical protein
VGGLMRRRSSLRACWSVVQRAGGAHAGDRGRRRQVSRRPRPWRCAQRASRARGDGGRARRGAQSQGRAERRQGECGNAAPAALRHARRAIAADTPGASPGSSGRQPVRGGALECHVSNLRGSRGRSGARSTRRRCRRECRARRGLLLRGRGRAAAGSCDALGQRRERVARAAIALVQGLGERRLRMSAAARLAGPRGACGCGRGCAPLATIATARAKLCRGDGVPPATHAHESALRLLSASAEPVIRYAVRNAIAWCSSTRDS